MRHAFQTPTPELAAVMLADNPANRPIKRYHVEAMARDMQAGRWQTNGDAIRMNCDGSLIDGQHRLSACIKAGVPFESVVISGLPANVRATIDGGAKRSHGDRLAMAGVHNANQVSANTRLIAGIATGQGRRINLTSQELDTILDAHSGIHDSTRTSRGASKAMPAMAAILGAIHYIGTATGHGSKADAFVHVFQSGVPAYQGCAAHALRERIIKNRGELTQYVPDDLIKAACQSWRHFATSTPVKMIRTVDDIRLTGWTPDRLGL